ncbi:hypothetical protein F4810DRAFT_96024 [Camillea tinctor]|nr:hypothetical protein F4810DRAFT_96024 [Camillea tinctor]
MEISNFCVFGRWGCSAGGGRWYLQTAPLPSNVKSYNGKRRPHAHKDMENHYKTEAAQAHIVAAKQRPGYDPSQPVLWGYVADHYDYSQQNSKGHSKIGQDEGFKRIITDEYKNQQGLSYHPWNNRKDFERAPVVERPVPPGRRNTGRPGRL